MNRASSELDDEGPFPLPIRRLRDELYVPGAYDSTILLQKLRKQVLEHLTKLNLVNLGHLYRTVIIVLFGFRNDVSTLVFGLNEFWTGGNQLPSLYLERAFIDAMLLAGQDDDLEAGCKCIEFSWDVFHPKTLAPPFSPSPMSETLDLNERFAWCISHSRSLQHTEKTTMSDAKTPTRGLRNQSLSHSLELRGSHEALKSTLWNRFTYTTIVLLHYLGVHPAVPEHISNFEPKLDHILAAYFPGIISATDAEKEMIRAAAVGARNRSLWDLRHLGPYDIISKTLNGPLEIPRLLNSCLSRNPSDSSRKNTLSLETSLSLLEEAARTCQSPSAFIFLKEEMNISSAAYHQHALNVATENGANDVIMYLGSEVQEIKVEAFDHYAFRIAVRSLDLGKIRAVVSCYQKRMALCLDEEERKGLLINPLVNRGQAIVSVCEEENVELSELVLGFLDAYFEGHPDLEYPPCPPGPGYDWRGECVIACCGKGFLVTLKKLLESPWSKRIGLEPGIANNAGIRYACSNGRVEVVKYLLDSGKVDSAAFDGAALVHSCRYGHAEVCFIVHVPFFADDFLVLLEQVVDLLLNHPNSTIHLLVQAWKASPHTRLPSFFADAVVKGFKFSDHAFVKLFCDLGLHREPGISAVFANFRLVDGKWVEFDGRKNVREKKWWIGTPFGF
ncbi:hypothetical protein HDU97_003360 [Phlyctochytrium planicorne]|nr:hypothetical protein HDU97_003360 [Phlyctochytrium planicorne]